MLTRLSVKMFAFALLLSAAQLVPQQAQAQTQTKAYYEIQNPKFAMSNSIVRCSEFSPSTFSRIEYVSINQTGSFSWWATCTRGDEVLRIDLTYTVTGSPTRLWPDKTVPSKVSVKAVAKLSRNGSTCTTRIKNYEWGISKLRGGYINQFLQEFDLSGCSSTGRVTATEHIGGTN